MARSEEQKKDLKRKLWTLATLCVVGVPLVVIGPGLGSVIRSIESDPMHPDAPSRLLLCAHLQNNTMRSADARRTLERWIELYVDEETKDFEGVLNGEGEWTITKYGLGRGLEARGFTPWLWPEGKPPAVQRANDALVADALETYGLILEDVTPREYERAAHIYVCLANMWSENSIGQLAGEAGVKRISMLSF